MQSDSGVVRKDVQWDELTERIRQQTPARLLEGRSGASYRTATQLQLRADHASARDAVQTELDLSVILGQEFVDRWQLFEVSTRATSKAEYLLRPDLGRVLDDAACSAIRERCVRSADLQIVIGDGLSVKAVYVQLPELLPLLFEKSREQDWSVGRPFVIRHCRVGVMNGIGDLLNSKAVVLLVGERPGLATAESLSAYLAYCPRPGHTDADRNLVSNIHRNGVRPAEAAVRIIKFIQAMLRNGTSGVHLKEAENGARIISE